MRAVRCDSWVAAVVVYARGAEVTRAVTLPGDLPADSVKLVIPGVSPVADPGSVRAEVSGQRTVLGVGSRLVVPPAPQEPGALRKRATDLARERAELATALETLKAARGDLLQLLPQPLVDGRSRSLDPRARLADTLKMNDLVDELAREVDAQITELEDALRQNDRSLAEADLAVAQARSADVAGEGHPTREVFVEIASGSGDLTQLELIYTVALARWWPAYTARLEGDSTTARLSLQAYVTQQTMEDWTEVRLAVSTADMVADTRHPRLASARLGRAQAKPPTGFREPPPGLRAMFAGYDEMAIPLRDSLDRDSGAEQPATTTTRRATHTPPADREPGSTVPPQAPAPDTRGTPMSAAPVHSLAPPELAHDAPTHVVPPGAMPTGPAPPPAAEPPPSAAGPPAAVEQEIDLAAEWLDFDALVLAGPDDLQRGRLVRATAADRGATLDGYPASDWRPAAPSGTHDPLSARGQFDHRYDAEGVADILSTSRPHRIQLAERNAVVTQTLRAAPRDESAAFRALALRNPFDAPLLTGPVDVLVDGTLTATTLLQSVDRRGWVKLGHGTEERIRVARNVRTSEATAGVLSHHTAIDHRVTVDLASALGEPVEIEVVDRLPVTDDPEVEVTLVASAPQAAHYDQSDLGAPIRGGMRWTIPVPAGGSASITYTYRIMLPLRREIVGGNRRE